MLDILGRTSTDWTARLGATTWAASYAAAERYVPYRGTNRKRAGTLYLHLRTVPADQHFTVQLPLAVSPGTPGGGRRIDPMRSARSSSTNLTALPGANST